MLVKLKKRMRCNMKSPIIYGAGFAGLLAGQMFRQANPEIWEASKELPDNHEAVLRFRSDAIEKYTGIELEKVFVRKAIVHNDTMYGNPDIHLCNLYSQKVSGTISNRSIWNLDDCTRYLSKGGLTEKLSKDLTIYYNQPLKTIEDLDRAKGIPIISTIPMPTMMNIVGWKDVPTFKIKPIWVIKAVVNQVDSCINQTIYFPGCEPYYRATLSGGKLIIECSREPEIGTTIIKKVLVAFGIESWSFAVESKTEQKFGKITKIDDDIRKAFMYHMTQKYGVYSLGRFATWRNILLDDVIDDCLKIKTMINSNEYEQKLLR